MCIQPCLHYAQVKAQFDSLYGKNDCEVSIPHMWSGELSYEYLDGLCMDELVTLKDDYLIRATMIEARVAILR